MEKANLERQNKKGCIKSLMSVLVVKVKENFLSILEIIARHDKTFENAKFINSFQQSLDSLLEEHCALTTVGGRGSQPPDKCRF